MFFAVHLFREQIFSMSDHLERILKQFLKVNRMECCHSEARKKYAAAVHEDPVKGPHKDWKIHKEGCMGTYLCHLAGHCLKSDHEICKKDINSNESNLQQSLQLQSDNKTVHSTTDHETKTEHANGSDDDDDAKSAPDCTNNSDIDCDTGAVRMHWDKHVEWREWMFKLFIQQYRQSLIMKAKGKDSGNCDEKEKRRKLSELKERANDLEEKNDVDIKTLNTDKEKEINGEMEQFRRKMTMKHRVMEILWMKFEHFRKTPNPQQRVRFDQISPQLLRFFTHNKDVEETEKDGKPKGIPQTISFQEIMMVYPNAKTITFVNRHLNHEGHNTSCLNGLVIQSLLYEVWDEDTNKAKKSPLEKVVFTYYDYEGDIFKANKTLWTGDENKEKGYFVEDILRDQKGADNENHEYRKKLTTADWRFKHHKIGSGYKIRIERRSKK